jgi:hypothetical protein
MKKKSRARALMRARRATGPGRAMKERPRTAAR